MQPDIGNSTTEIVTPGEYLADLDTSQLAPDTRPFNPSIESLPSTTQMSPPQMYHESRRDGPFGATNGTFNTSSGSLAARQQYGQSTPPPTPSLRLRNMLAKYHDFLEEGKKLESEITSEDDGEGIGNMVVPEPENDEEYCPTKRSSRRTRKMTLKKKESDKMAQKKKNGGSRKQKKPQEDSEAGQDGNYAGEASKSANVQKTPTKRQKGDTPAESDPPSSGRIKLIVRSSRNATPTRPKGHKSTDVMPTQRPLAPKPAPVPTAAKSAVSAKHAIYAAMSTSAHFAQTAVRRSGQNNETEIPRILRNQIQPNELRAAFENIRSEGVQYADRASFALTAEKADCAGVAFEADDANEVLTGEGKGNEEDAT